MANSQGGIATNLRQLIDADVRAVGVRDDATDVSYVRIPMPAWIPDSYLRSLKKDLYFKMLNMALYNKPSISLKTANDLSGENPNGALEFFIESGADNSSLLQKLGKSALKSVATYATNQICSVVSKVESIVNQVSSFFSDEKDDTSVETLSSEMQAFIQMQPYLTIYGIHHAENIREASKQLDSIINEIKSIGEAWKSIKEFVSKTFVGDQSKGAAGATENNSDSKLKRICLEIIERNKSNSTYAGALSQYKSFDGRTLAALLLTKQSLRLHSIADFIYRNRVAGKYTAIGYVPLSKEQRVIFTSSGSNNFSQVSQGNPNSKPISDNPGVGKEHNFLSNMFTSLKGVLSDFASSYFADMNIVQGLERVLWKTDAQTQMPPITTKFTIYNDTLEHYFLNIGFILKMTALTQQTTDGLFIRSPYLFDIIVPGGIRHPMCSCKFSCSTRGLLRQIGNVDDGGSQGNFADPFFSDLMVSKKFLEYAPDAYNIEITFTSILPAQWNFVHAYITEFEAEPTLGVDLDDALTKIISA